jgi:hypothetical protein
VLSVNGFSKDMSATTSETISFLDEPHTSLLHEIRLAAGPHLSRRKKVACTRPTGRFDDVLAHGLGIERRQLSMPIDGFRIGDVVHVMNLRNSTTPPQALGRTIVSSV